MAEACIVVRQQSEISEEKKDIATGVLIAIDARCFHFLSFMRNALVYS